MRKTKLTAREVTLGEDCDKIITANSPEATINNDITNDLQNMRVLKSTSAYKNQNEQQLADAVE